MNKENEILESEGKKKKENNTSEKMKKWIRNQNEKT